MNKFIVYFGSEELDRYNFYQEDIEDDREDVLVDEKKKLDDLKKIQEIMKYLPPREHDILNLYFFKDKDQQDIGAIFNLTQGDISYRIKRAIERIKFIMELPKISKKKMAKDLWMILPSKIYVNIMVGIYQTTSQSFVAQTVGLSQAKVRHQFLKYLEILKKVSKRYPQYKLYYDVFSKINDNNFNKVRELQVQDRWKGKYTKTVL